MAGAFLDPLTVPVVADLVERPPLADLAHVIPLFVTARHQVVPRSTKRGASAHPSRGFDARSMVPLAPGQKSPRSFHDSMARSRSLRSNQIRRQPGTRTTG